MRAVLNFRTESNGGFKWTRGLTTGHWRVLIVNDPRGSLRVGSKNVVEVLDRSARGLRGVTPRSGYYLEYACARLAIVAAEYNNTIGGLHV